MLKRNAMLALLLTLWVTAVAHAQEPTDVWTEPNPGLRHLHRTMHDPPVSIHALVVDLTAPGVRVAATPQRARWSTVSDFARGAGAAAAVNGGFWGLWQRPTGVTAGDGAMWRNSEPDPDFGHFAIRRDGRAVVNAPGEGENPRTLARLSDAVSGRPMLVVNGDLDRESLASFATSNHRQPRTAVGVSRDGRKVILIVADGRQDHSRGLNLHQLAGLMVDLGAHRAINLDGGGSSAMYIEHEGGLLSSPSRGRWVRALGLDTTETRPVRTRGRTDEVFVRGVEREVMNHLAVFAPAPAASPPVPGEDRSASAERAQIRTASFVPSDRQPVRIGRLREVLYPILWVSVPLGALCVPALWWRRRRRAKSVETPTRFARVKRAFGLGAPSGFRQIGRAGLKAPADNSAAKADVRIDLGEVRGR